MVVSCAMGSFSNGRTAAEHKAVYAAQVRALRALAKELKIPAAEAEGLIEEALVAALVQKRTGEPEKWLAATLTAAAKRRVEGGG